MTGRIAVVGGANVDIGGFSAVSLVKGDSNPGQVRISAGGVGRNIAEGCARLGLDVQMITAVGGDPNGDFLRADCAAKGIDLEESLVLPEQRTSVYLFIDDADGDMYCAVNDMEIQRKLTPTFLATKIDVLNGCDAVVIDANLDQESILYLARNVKVPLFADAVSSAKAGRLLPILSSLYCLKANAIEAGLLLGRDIQDVEQARKAAEDLLKIGIDRTFVTLGANGVVCADVSGVFTLPCASQKVVNATGAGDAFMAALVWAFTKGCDLKDSCKAGMAASAIAVESVLTVSPEMNPENLNERMEIL